MENTNLNQQDEDGDAVILTGAWRGCRTVTGTSNVIQSAIQEKCVQ